MAVSKYGNSGANYGISGVINQKKKWHDATAAGDTAAAAAAEKEANKYYTWLENNGYASQAAQLRNQNYTQAAAANKTGLVPVRSVANTITSTYNTGGKTANDYLSYDNDTGEVSFAGTNLGAPIEIDGVSYMKQSDISDAVNNTMKSLGFRQNDDIAYGQMRDTTADYISENRDAANRFYNQYLSRNDELTDTALNDDPMKYDWAKSLMGYYNWGGNNAANGEMASGAASNGGNVDSFAAANAQRQQLAYTNAGVNAVQSNWLERLGIAQSNLNSLAAKQSDTMASLENNVSQQQALAQQTFDNSETAKNNQSSRNINEKLADAEIRASDAGITGYIPEELKVKNPYLNDDGTIMSSYIDKDFKQAIDEINAQLENENLTDAERKSLILNRSQLAETRRVKTGMDGYTQYSSLETDKYILSPEETADMRLNQAQMDNATLINRENNALTKYDIDTNAQLERDAMSWEATEAEKERAFEAEQSAKAAAAAKSGGSGGKSGNDISVKLTDDDILSYAGRINAEIGKQKTSSGKTNYEVSGLAIYKNDNGYGVNPGNEEAVALRIMNLDLTDSQKKQLLEKFGISANILNTIQNDEQYK